MGKKNKKDKKKIKEFKKVENEKFKKLERMARKNIMEEHVKFVYANHNHIMNAESITIPIEDYLAILAIAVERSKVIPVITNVEYKNDRVTIMHFSDGTFTKAICQKDEVFSKDAGFAICFAKKVLGNKLYAKERICFVDKPEEELLDEMFEPVVDNKNDKTTGYSEDVKQRARELFAGGMSKKNIAEKLKISKSSVYRWTKNNN
jgi:glutamyl/glutaminyl-tRNA synthetase